MSASSNEIKPEAPDPLPADALPEPLEEVVGPKPLAVSRVLGYSLANLGYGMFYSFNNATLSLYLEQFTKSQILLNLMGSSHSFEGAVIQPLVGSASDRLRTRLGRRRPFMLLFTPLSALFLLLTPLASHLPNAMRLTIMVICIFLFTVFFNMAQDPYQALMPDITPKPQRGRVTSVWMFVGVVGQATLLLLRLDFAVKFGLVAAVMLVTTLLTCVATAEPTLPPESEAAQAHHRRLIEALGGLRTLRQARKAMGALFCYGFGIGAVLPSLTRFVVKVTNCTDHQAEMMFLVLMVATLVGVLPLGRLTDRIGPQKVLLFGMVCIAIAALNGLWVTTLPQVAVVLALAGLGNAAQSASAYPLLTSLIPAEEVGFYTGLQTTALSIAAPLTSILTGLLVERGGYRFIFVVCAASVLGALAIISTIRTAAAPAEIHARNIEQGREE